MGSWNEDFLARYSSHYKIYLDNVISIQASSRSTLLLRKLEYLIEDLACAGSFLWNYILTDKATFSMICTISISIYDE